MDYYLPLKYCRRQFTLLPLYGTNKSPTIKIQQQIARFLTCFGLKWQVKGGLNNSILLIGFQIKSKSKKSFKSKQFNSFNWLSN